MIHKIPIVALVLSLVLTASLSGTAWSSEAAPSEVVYFDLAVDGPRQLLYASDRDGGSLHVISLATLEVLSTVPVGSQPVGLDISPDGSELAVALYGQGEIAIVDLNTLAVVSRLVPDVDTDPNLPYDVLYGRPGRLYSTGNPGSTGFDYVHVFDTISRTEIGRSSAIMRAAPRLAMTADQNTMYVSQVVFFPQQIYRFDITTDAPAQTATGPHGPVLVDTLCVMPDGRVFTSAGQVWSADLGTLLATLPASGSQIECSPAAQRVYIGTETSVVAFDTDSLTALYTYRLPGVAGVARLDEQEKILYASTSVGVRVVVVDIQTQVVLPLITRNYCHGFFDDFSNPASGWPVVDSANVRAGYRSGEYLVHTKTSGYLYLFWAPTCNYENFTLEVDARWLNEPGQSYGLIFGIQEDFSSYYLFDMNTDAYQYRLYRRDPGGFTQIAPITTSGAIHLGTETNHMAVTRNGVNMTLYINGMWLGTWYDGNIPGPGGVGIVSSPYSSVPESDALFDNFRLVRLPAPAPATVHPAAPDADAPGANPLQNILEPAPPDW